MKSCLDPNEGEREERVERKRRNREREAIDFAVWPSPRRVWSGFSGIAMGVRFGLREARYGAVGVAASDRGYDTHGGTDEQTHMQITQGKKIACLTRELEATCQANKHERTKTTPCILPTECLMGVVWEDDVVPCSHSLRRTSEFMWISKNAYCMRLEEVEAREEG